VEEVREERCRDFGDPGALALASRVLAEQQVAVLPTDTLYGFSVLGSSASGVERLLELKGVPRRRGFVALVAGVEALVPYLDAGQDLRGLDFLRRVWPAPLTAVMRVRAPVPWAEPVESGWTGAFRMPAHSRLCQLLQRVGTPFLSTSVNRTGAAPLLTLDAIRLEFGGEPDVWMFRDRGLESATAASASTLADFTTWPPRVLRAGRFDLEAALATSQAPRPEGRARRS
jgi:L-threonylcarbamoyladenylate synthase